MAEELAKIGSDEAIEALIAMVEGRKINLFSRYTLKDQIIGIDALVLTNKFKSLNYLKSLLQESISASSEEYLIHDAGYKRLALLHDITIQTPKVNYRTN